MTDILTGEMNFLIRKQFPEAEQEKAREILLAYQNDTAGGTERIRIGMLELAKGDLCQLQIALRVAQKDYRDLIVAAEYENVESRLVHKPEFAVRLGKWGTE